MTPGAIPLITKSVIRPKDWFRLQMWQVRMGVYAGADAPDLLCQQPPSAGQGSEPSYAARPRAASLRCAGILSLRRALRFARSAVGRALSITTALAVNAAGLALIMAVPISIVAVVASVSPPQEPEPTCRHQWTPDARYVEHCDRHDGRGFLEVGND